MWQLEGIILIILEKFKSDFHRYKQNQNIDENQGRTTKIDTILNTGQLEGNDVSICIQGKVCKLRSVILHHGISNNIITLSYLYACLRWWFTDRPLPFFGAKGRQLVADGW